MCMYDSSRMSSVYVSLPPCPLGNHEAVVRINARGITGTITFIEVDETTTRVIADLQGVQG